MKRKRNGRHYACNPHALPYRTNAPPPAVRFFCACGAETSGLEDCERCLSMRSCDGCPWWNRHVQHWPWGYVDITWTQLILFVLFFSGLAWLTWCTK